MGRKKDKHSNSDDDALFRDAMRDVEPLRQRARHRHRKPPAPKARFRRADDAAVLHEALRGPADGANREAGEELAFHGPRVSRAVFRQLRRGHYAVQNEIDLHGLTEAEARLALREFIDGCIDEGLRCIRVVHGKGHGSGPGGPVLKRAVGLWLRQWQEVSAFVTAQPRDGGTGAVYVLLSR